jgi:propanol-preferring alcohol dehydrogenase
MKAMVLRQVQEIKHNEPLEYTDWPDPVPDPDELVMQISACGVCHTELDEIEGRTPPSNLPMILGHQAVGKIVEIGSGVTRRKIGDRVGVGWIFSSCLECEHCLSGNENLCQEFKATGRDSPGGYAEYLKIKESFSFRIPEHFTDIEASPLLCAGAIGYRSLRLTGIRNGQTLGLTGFGASGHLVLKMVKYKLPDTNVYVFARSEKERNFAKELGAVWSGHTEDYSPEKLDAIIDTTPVWKPVVEAMKNLVPGGRLVINAIRKEEIDKEELLSLNYPEDLWMEKEIKSVANVARNDIEEFLTLAAEISIKPEIETFSLLEANIALSQLKNGQIQGAKVLCICAPQERDETYT